MAAVENQLGTAASVSWIMASKKLKLNIQSKLHLHKLHQHQSIPKDMSQYNNLVRVYNRLIEEHEKLEMDASLLLMHTFDPTCLEDSAHLITRSVSHWLLDEIDVIGNSLREARHILRSSRSPM